MEDTKMVFQIGLVLARELRVAVFALSSRNIFLQPPVEHYYFIELIVNCTSSDPPLLWRRLHTVFRFILRAVSHSSGRRRSCEGSVPIRCPRCRTISQSAPSSMPPPWRWRATTGRSSAAPGRTCTWEPLGRSVCRHSRSCWAWRMLTNVFCDDIGLS